ncbi:MAG: hypothetical protein KGQ88_06715, partial [Chloroflexi bacterium]|nr:hypothetical protein [Chloroflexota bacterium]
VKPAAPPSTARPESAPAPAPVRPAPAPEATVAADVRPAPPLLEITPPPAPRAASVPSAMSTAEERAVTYLGQRDPRAAAECLAAARELLDAHKDLAAADLLIAHVASGMRDRDVQRLLISVDRAIGRSDIAAEKAQLLARILELDGDPIGARDVQRLSRAS